MKYFQEIVNGIYVLKVPFENIYTSVFALINNNELILCDTATTKSDVEQYIVPAIDEIGIAPSYIVISHSHGDHSGGIKYLKDIYPEATVLLFNENHAKKENITNYRVLNDGEVVSDTYKIFNLKGHSPDSLSVLDIRTYSILSFDCFQLFGVGRYGTGVMDINDYLESVLKVEKMKVKNLIASHDFVPLGAVMTGEEKVKEFLSCCRESIEYYKGFADNLKEKTSEQLAQIYKEQNPDLPPVSQRFFENLIKQ